MNSILGRWESFWAPASYSAVALATPGHPAAKAQEGKRLLETLLATPERMTPEERGRARVQFLETRQMSPQERQAGWEAYQALPAEEKRELAQRATPATGRSAASASEP